MRGGTKVPGARAIQVHQGGRSSLDPPRPGTSRPRRALVNLWVISGGGPRRHRSGPTEDMGEASQAPIVGPEVSEGESREGVRGATTRRPDWIWTGAVQIFRDPSPEAPAAFRATGGSIPRSGTKVELPGLYAHDSGRLRRISAFPTPRAIGPVSLPHLSLPPSAKSYGTS